MKWAEFSDLLSGIGPETPLGRIVSIRAEKNPDVLKHFTKEQMRIWGQWQNRKAGKMQQEELGQFLEQMKNAFIAMAR